MHKRYESPYPTLSLGPIRFVARHTPDGRTVGVYETADPDEQAAIERSHSFGQMKVVESRAAEGDPKTDEELTAREITALLHERGVEIPKKVNKAELVALLKANPAAPADPAAAE